MKYSKLLIILLLINFSLILPMNQVTQVIQDELITTKAFTDKKTIKALFYLFHEHEYEEQDQENLKNINCVAVENLRENNCINIYFINKSQDFQYIQIPKTNFEALKKIVSTTYEFPISFEESSETPPEELPFEDEYPFTPTELDTFIPVDNKSAKAEQEKSIEQEKETLSPNKNIFKQKLNHKITNTKNSKLLICNLCKNYYMEKLYNNQLEHYKYCKILNELYTSNLIETYKLRFLLRRFSQREGY